MAEENGSEHRPVQPETYAIMNALARGIDTALNAHEQPKKWGFALLVFPFGEPFEDRMNYIGNGKREDVLVAIKEMAARWEGRHPEPDETVSS